MKSQFGFVFLFFLAGILLVTVVMLVAKLIRKDKPNEEKNTTYESGEATEGSSQVAFNIKFYVIAVIFLLFEVELLLLFPWSVVFSDKEAIAASDGNWLLYSGAEILVFVGLLALGLAYVWKKGHLDWIKSKETPSELEWPLAAKDYTKLNKSLSQKKASHES
ncbi:MAG: NADH-quinone oxidoreductase subunit A [Leadbetterella sp.]